MISMVAEKAGLHLGSRGVDLFRGVVRLSFEKEILTNSPSCVRPLVFNRSDRETRKTLSIAKGLNCLLPTVSFYWDLALDSKINRPEAC